MKYLPFAKGKCDVENGHIVVFKYNNDRQLLTRLSIYYVAHSVANLLKFKCTLRSVYV